MLLTFDSKLQTFLLLGHFYGQIITRGCSLLSMHLQLEQKLQFIHIP